MREFYFVQCTSEIKGAAGYWLRGGIAFWLTGTDVRSNSRRRASRWRCAWRNILAWAPVVAFQAVLGIWFISLFESEIENIAVESARTLSLLGAYMGIFGLVQLLGFATSVLQPRRGLQDLLAGTYLVRR